MSRDSARLALGARARDPHSDALERGGRTGGSLPIRGKSLCVEGRPSTAQLAGGRRRGEIRSEGQ